MTKEKTAAQYADMYAKVLTKQRGIPYDEAYTRFRSKYLELVSSPDYERFDREHGKNLSIEKIYVALAVYFVSTELGCSFEESMDAYYGMARPIWNKFSKVVNFLEGLPGGFWLFSHFLHRFNESYGSSIAYSRNELGKDRYEYEVSKCAYIEIFEHYGIRKFCKVMCDSDIGVMGGACKHAKFIRYHDMTEADTCHDVLVRVGSAADGEEKR